MSDERTYLLNDDCTDVEIVRPSSYGWAEPMRERKSRRRKHPLGFQTTPPLKKPAKKPA